MYTRAPCLAPRRDRAERSEADCRASAAEWIPRTYHDLAARRAGRGPNAPIRIRTPEAVAVERRHGSPCEMRCEAAALSGQCERGRGRCRLSTVLVLDSTRLPACSPKRERLADQNPYGVSSNLTGAPHLSSILPSELRRSREGFRGSSEVASGATRFRAAFHGQSTDTVRSAVLRKLIEHRLDALLAVLLRAREGLRVDAHRGASDGRPISGNTDPSSSALSSAAATPGADSVSFNAEGR